MSVILKPGREKSVLNHHPWVFSGAIESAPQDGIVDCVVSSDGRFLGWGYYDSQSHIPLHILSLDSAKKPDDDWCRSLLRQAILRRRAFFDGQRGDTNAFRLFFGEADYLGGLTVDVYGRTLRVIFSSRLAWSFKAAVLDELEKALHPQMIIASTDPSFSSSENLDDVTEYYRSGERFIPQGSLPPIKIRENGIAYSIIPGSGQKGGFFCDQRESRQALEPWCKDASVLDCCCYTGGFTLHALRGGAGEVLCLDSSRDALELLTENVRLNVSENRIPADSESRVTVCRCNAFEHLRTVEAGRFDVIVLDPPKLAVNKSGAARAMKAYKDLNRIAMEKIARGGLLVTCSCSGAISAEDFRTVLGWAAKDAGAEVQILKMLFQPEDHPIRLSLPESAYLKVFFTRVIK